MVIGIMEHSGRRESAGAAGLRKRRRDESGSQAKGHPAVSVCSARADGHTQEEGEQAQARERGRASFERRGGGATGTNSDSVATAAADQPATAGNQPTVPADATATAAGAAGRNGRPAKGKRSGGLGGPEGC